MSTEKDIKEALKRIRGGEAAAKVAKETSCNRTELSILSKYYDLLTGVNSERETVNTIACSNCETVNSLSNEKDRLLTELEKACSNCTEKSELTTALLQISDLRQELEGLRAFPSPAPEKDCGQCEKLLTAEIETLKDHKTKLMSKCDRLQIELSEAEARARIAPAPVDCTRCPETARMAELELTKNTETQILRQNLTSKNIELESERDALVLEKEDVEASHRAWFLIACVLALILVISVVVRLI